MYSLLKMLIFHCYVSLPEGNHSFQPRGAILGSIRWQGPKGLWQKIDDGEFQLRKEMLKFCYPPDQISKNRRQPAIQGSKSSKLFGGLQLADTNVASGDVNPMYHGSYSECENTTDFPQTSQSFTNIWPSDSTPMKPAPTTSTVADLSFRALMLLYLIKLKEDACYIIQKDSKGSFAALNN